MSREESVKFPLSEAFSFSLESIKRRFGRALVTMASIILGISFLSFLLTTGRIVSIMQQQSGTAVQAYQIWMAIIAILICAVGIVNSMLMSVTERYKEIGTIKCLGARNGHVLEIFLIEAFLLGLIGGAIGAVSGWGIAALWQYLLPLMTQQGSVQTEALIIAARLWLELNVNEPLILLSNPLIGIALSVFIALISSIVPAYIAAKLSPTEALRYEA
ncbi:MAG: FtsX-like permease family protein [Thermoproteota archaeon]|nr:FtsX-like permease family protein [Candidatus Brockarchaeota archaeon]